ncbi:Nn.00g021910.m01.CDS01 [Neocucurbitaria sp. VM-36]
MPPRPFPYPLRVGIDICNVSRLRAIITRTSDDKPSRSLSQFIIRILTYPERVYFRNRFGPPEEALNKVDAVAQFLAGRFAAKEACRKACMHLDKNARGFHQIIILPIASLNRNDHQSSRPQGLILDKVYSEIHEAYREPIKPNSEGVVRKVSVKSLVDLSGLEGQLCEISISHDGGFATAVAIVPSMFNSQMQEHAPLSLPPAQQIPSAATHSWDKLTEVEGQLPLSAEIESRIKQVVDERLAALRHGKDYVD